MGKVICVWVQSESPFCKRQPYGSLVRPSVELCNGVGHTVCVLDQSFQLMVWPKVFGQIKQISSYQSSWDRMRRQHAAMSMLPNGLPSVRISKAAVSPQLSHSLPPFSNFNWHCHHYVTNSYNLWPSSPLWGANSVTTVQKKEEDSCTNTSIIKPGE